MHSTARHLACIALKYKVPPGKAVPQGPQTLRKHCERVLEKAPVSKMCFDETFYFIFNNCFMNSELVVLKVMVTGYRFAFGPAGSRVFPPISRTM